MCKQGSWKKLKIGNKEVNIDNCIYKIVKSLNESGLETIACCCGHGKQPPRISLKTGQELMIFDYATAQEISKRFKPLNQFKKNYYEQNNYKTKQ